MSNPQAFINGKLVPSDECSVPVYDNGFILGVTVAEQQRTFRGAIFRLDQHLDRLLQSLQIVGVQIQWSKSELSAMAHDLLTHNLQHSVERGDLGLCIFVTPGPEAKFFPSEAMRASEELQPLVCMHTYPLPFHQWAELYRSGQPLVIPQIREVPVDCWPHALKCRSRMHYYLADRQARQVDPKSRALLLDTDGFVAEASTASVLMYTKHDGIVAPSAEKVLPSISVAQVEDLAHQLDVPFSRRDIATEDILRADEVLLCSTSPCVLPVCSIDGQSVADGKPGPMFERLIAGWSELVGIDIRAQAESFA